MAVLLPLYILVFSIMYLTYHSTKYVKQFPWIKLSVSLGFILIATYSAVLSQEYALFFRMLPAFILAALGDLLLGFAHTRNDYYGREFMLGVGSFLTAHIIFYLALTTIVPAQVVDFVLPLGVMALILFLSQNKNLALDKMKIPAIIYSFFVGLLFSKSLMIILSAGVTIPHMLILTGSFLFLTSDLVLLFLNFHIAPPKCLAFINLSTYYAGLALLGLSLYPFA